MNTCQTCGKERHPVAKPGNCQACHSELLRQHHDTIWMQRLKDKGYTFHKYDCYLPYKGIHAKVEVTNHECGHTFIAKLDNILNDFTKCGVCGPKTRTKNATKGYIAKFGRTYDLKLWKDYRLQVEILSNKYYNENKAMMNPLDHPRMKPNSHPNAVNLDHIIPIIYGFKNGLSPELIADGRNLRIICATQNLRKKQKLTDEARALLDSLL